MVGRSGDRSELDEGQGETRIGDTQRELLSRGSIKQSDSRIAASDTRTRHSFLTVSVCDISPISFRQYDPVELFPIANNDSCIQNYQELKRL